MDTQLMINQAVTAPEEVASIREDIAIREQELASFDGLFQKEKEKFQKITILTDKLSRQYTHLTKLLEFHQNDLSVHRQQLSDMNDLNACPSHSEETFDLDFKSDLPLFPDQLREKKNVVSQVTAKLVSLQDQLHSKLRVMPFIQKHVHAMEQYRDTLLKIIRGLEATLRIGMPVEVWEVIFRHRLLGDFQDYLVDPGTVHYRSTVIILGQVCKLWRHIVQSRSDLWQYFICGPEQVDTTEQIQRWQYSVSFEPRNLVFVSNLSALSEPCCPHQTQSKAREVMSSTPHSLHLLCEPNDKALEIAKGLPFKDQSSLVLQFITPITQAFLNKIATCFPRFSNLKIVHNLHLRKIDPNLYERRNPAIETLTLDLTSFESFQIEYYCEEPLLKEIHVTQNGTSTLQGRTMECPLLEIVGITPPDVAWLKNYRLPRLQQLLLYGPKLHDIAAPSLIPLSKHPDFQNAAELEIRKWPVYSPADTQPWSIMPLILAISDKLRSVKVIRCVDSHIDGESLISLVSQLQKTGNNQINSKLSTVVIDCCTGITRVQCEQLAGLVEKLVIHV